MSTTHYLVEVATAESTTKIITTTDADPMVLAVAYMIDTLGSSEHVLSNMEVRNRGLTSSSHSAKSTCTSVMLSTGRPWISRNTMHSPPS
jgi:hypothetical protein